MDTSADDGISVTYRPLTPEEKAILKSKTMGAIITAILLLTVMPSFIVGGAFFFGYQLTWWFLLIIIWPVISGGIMAWMALAASKDELFGSVKVYQGFVTDKYWVPGKPSQYILKMSDAAFGDTGREWELIQVGDEVILEYTVHLHELQRAFKTGRVNPAYKKPKVNPNIPVVDKRAFGGTPF